MNRLAEYIDIVYKDLSNQGQIEVQQVHQTTKRDQFLLKLTYDFEGIRSNLMNRALVPFLDICLNELLREEQCVLTQASMEQQKFDNQCKKDGCMIKECITKPTKKTQTTFIATVDPSTIGCESKYFCLCTINAPKMVQQMIISAFFALGLLDKPFSSCISWYFDSDTSNHMIMKK